MINMTNQCSDEKKAFDPRTSTKSSINREQNGQLDRKKTEVLTGPGALALNNFNVGVIVFVNLSLLSLSIFFDTISLKSDTTVQRRYIPLECSTEHPEVPNSCRPERCGQVVVDNFIPEDDLEHLLRLTHQIVKSSNITQDVSATYDFAEGAQSLGSDKGITIYRNVQNAIRNLLAKEFVISVSGLTTTFPTFLGKITNITKPSDEWWLAYVKNTLQKNVRYSAMLSLGTYTKDFVGGRDIEMIGVFFSVSEPKKGRLKIFTSGSEMSYYREKVTSGIRYFLMFSFSCNSTSSDGD